MGLYTYEAFSAKGKRVQGSLDAGSEQEARSQLKAKGLVVRHLHVSIEETSDKNSSKTASLRGHETVYFLHELSTLIGSGMPLPEALSVIAEGMEKPKHESIVAGVRQLVLEGESLATALEAFNFDPVVINMISAGEETGQLHAVLQRLGAMLEYRMQMKQQILSAALYPLILIGFSIAILLVLLVVVVPRMAGVFEQMDADLPWITSFLIDMSLFFQQYGWILLTLTVLVISGLALAIRRPVVRQFIDKTILNIFWLGYLVRMIESAKFSRTLGMLLAGGVPILQAVKIAVQSISNTVVRISIEQSIAGVREGDSLASQLGKLDVMPNLAIRMISVGERSGALDSLLLKVADTLDHKTNNILQRMMTMLEPALIVIMAFLVGGVALAVLLPILDMNDLTR